MASRKIEDLQPPVAELARKFELLARNDKQGIAVLIYCTYRSIEEQNAAYAIGRTVKGEHVCKRKPFGNKITNAKGGQSMHQYGVAFDFVPTVGGKPLWADDALYLKCALIGESLGLEWAGRWLKFKEKAHMQFTNGHSLLWFQGGGKLK